ncbi:MAG: CarD family transcriptional regulator [Trueperaceae bacterium]|nr:CarD family transcriptional regulator [Trueperaceae bacterium]
MTFEVGDHVVYPSQGAGVVQEHTTREVLGERHEYLKVVFVKGDMEVLVPLRMGEEVGLRHTIGADEVDRLLDALVTGDLNLPLQWPPRYRAEQEVLARGSAYELARLIGVLARRDVEKGLAATEREVLDTAKSMLASELAVVTDSDLAAATRRLDDVIAERVVGG